MGTPWRFHWVILVFPCARGVPIVFPSCSHGIATLFQWDSLIESCSHGTWAFAWKSHGVPMGWTWCSHGMNMVPSWARVLPLESHGNTILVGLLRSHCVLMVVPVVFPMDSLITSFSQLPWRSLGTPMGLHDADGTPMVSHGTS